MDLSRFSMEGRTVIITGGSGGIGRGCVRAFAQAGANVVVASVPADTIPPAVEEAEALGAQALGVTVNVAEPGEIEAMVAQTLDRFGRIDALVNVAGGSYSRNPDMPQYARASLLEISGDDFVGAYIGNVKTTFLVSRAVVPHMKALGKGAIVNIGSTSGLDRHPNAPDIAGVRDGEGRRAQPHVPHGAPVEAGGAGELHRARHHQHATARGDGAAGDGVRRGAHRRRQGGRRRRHRQRGALPLLRRGGVRERHRRAGARRRIAPTRLPNVRGRRRKLGA